MTFLLKLSATTKNTNQRTKRNTSMDNSVFHLFLSPRSPSYAKIAHEELPSVKYDVQTNNSTKIYRNRPFFQKEKLIVFISEKWFGNRYVYSSV